MTEKALFHRPGTLVIKNEITGEYESIEKKIKDIEEAIVKKKKMNISQTNDTRYKTGIKKY